MVTEEPITIRFQLDKDKDQELRSSIKNKDALLPGEITRELITEDEIGQTYADPQDAYTYSLQYTNRYLSARFLTVQYGTYNGDPAALMHISFMFHSDNIKQYRFRRATIEIIFGVPPNTPSVIKCFPEIMYGTINPETRKWGYEFGPSIGSTLGGIVPAALQAKIFGQREYLRNNRMVIQGTIRGSHNNRVKWSIEEDDTQAQGIPRQLGFLLLVRTPEQGQKEFSAKFDVRASMGLSMNPARWLKDNRDDPVHFYRDFPFGRAVVAAGTDFVEEDFDKLVTLDNIHL